MNTRSLILSLRTQDQTQNRRLYFQSALMPQQGCPQLNLLCSVYIGIWFGAQLFQTVYKNLSQKWDISVIRNPQMLICLDSKDNFP